ncbi:hypothetical protein CR513_00113, partial [Mucuna pruriens]
MESMESTTLQGPMKRDRLERLQQEVQKKLGLLQGKGGLNNNLTLYSLFGCQIDQNESSLQGNFKSHEGIAMEWSYAPCKMIDTEEKKFPNSERPLLCSAQTTHQLLILLPPLESLQHNSSTQFLKLLHDGIGLLLGEPLLQNTWNLLHQVLGLLQPQVSEGPHFLDDLDLGSRIVLLQLQIKRRLLRRGTGVRPGGPGSRDGWRRNAGERSAVTVEAQLEPPEDGEVVPLKPVEIEKLVGNAFDLRRTRHRGDSAREADKSCGTPCGTARHCLSLRHT